MALTSARARRPLKARVTSVTAWAAGRERVLCGRLCPGLGATEEGRARLDEGRAPGQQVDHVVGAGDAARRHERHQGAAPDRGQERPDRPVLVRAVVVGQAAPVRTGLRALQAEGVGGDPERQVRLLGRRHRDHDECARPPATPARLRASGTPKVKLTAAGGWASTCSSLRG